MCWTKVLFHIEIPKYFHTFPIFPKENSEQQGVLLVKIEGSWHVERWFFHS